MQKTCQHNEIQRDLQIAIMQLQPLRVGVSRYSKKSFKMFRGRFRRTKIAMKDGPVFLQIEIWSYCYLAREIGLSYCYWSYIILLFGLVSFMMLLFSMIVGVRRIVSSEISSSGIKTLNITMFPIFFLFCTVFCLHTIKSGFPACSNFQTSQRGVQKQEKGQDGTQRSTSGRVPSCAFKRHGVNALSKTAFRAVFLLW